MCVCGDNELLSSRIPGIDVQGSRVSSRESEVPGHTQSLCVSFFIIESSMIKSTFDPLLKSQFLDVQRDVKPDLKGLLGRSYKTVTTVSVPYR